MHWTEGWVTCDGMGQCKILSCYPESHTISNYWISGIFYLIFSNLSWLWVSETAESETMDIGGKLYSCLVESKLYGWD